MAPAAPGGDVGDDAIERLAVHVDDPEHLAESSTIGSSTPPTRPLVELGVAHQRDPLAARLGIQVLVHVALGECAPDRRRRAMPTDPVEKSTGSGSFVRSGSSADRRRRAAG